MIPAKFLSKIGSQEVEIEGVKVKACHVTDNTHVIESKISQLMAALNRQRPVVGVDVKVTWGDQEKQQNPTIDLLILFGGNCCLIINLANLPLFPESLYNFLVNENICFVSTGLHDKLGCTTLKGRTNVILTGHIRSGRTALPLGHVVEVGDLAARVLKKPNLSKCGLEELHKQVRSSTDATDSPVRTRPLKPDSKASVHTAALPGTSGGGGGACPSWKAMVFTDEEIKYVIHDAYLCFAIGDKMLEILDAVDL